jgi:hypothetical protein
MARRSSSLLLMIALMLSLGFAHAQEARAAEKESQGSGQRIVGFGFNLAGGIWGVAAWADGEGGALPIGPYVEAISPELRIHPAEIFSIDLQWNVMWSVLFSFSGYPFFLQNIYATFHLTPRLPLSLALAPLVKLMVIDGAVLPGFGARIGLEFNGPGRRFCLGLHLKPSAYMVTDDSAGVAIPEVVFETTFTWYALKK